MSYHAAMKLMRNFKGKLYRNQQTGDLVEYCPHSYITYPVFEPSEEFKGSICVNVGRRLDHLKLICQFCGGVSYADVSNICEDEKEANTLVDKLVAENELSYKESKKNKNEKV